MTDNQTADTAGAPEPLPLTYGDLYGLSVKWCITINGRWFNGLTAIICALAGIYWLALLAAAPIGISILVDQAKDQRLKGALAVAAELITVFVFVCALTATAVLAFR